MATYKETLATKNSYTHRMGRVVKRGHQIKLNKQCKHSFERFGGPEKGRLSILTQ